MFSDLKKVKTTYKCSYKFIYTLYYKQLERKQREKMNDPWPKTIGIDEHGLFKDKKRGAREFATVFVDYTNKRLKEVAEGKSHAQLEKGIYQKANQEKKRSPTNKFFVCGLPLSNLFNSRGQQVFLSPNFPQEP